MENHPIGHITFGGQDLSACRIVYGTAEARTAAADLADCLHRAAGIDLPLVPDTEPEVEREIVIGLTARDLPEVAAARAELKNDGILFLAAGTRLYLQSESELGLQYAVSKFLEKYLGFLFLDEKNEVIQPADSIDLPGDLRFSHSSPLLYRHTDWGLSRSLRHRWGLNGEEGVRNRIIGFCHTMAALAGVPEPHQPCLTDENVYQTVRTNVRKWIEGNPGCRIVSVTQNDNQNFCKCPRCEALAAKENQSGVMLSFVNRLADDIREDYPDVNLLTFAYQYTRKPPVTIKPRDNVIIWLCSIECCFSHPLSDPQCERNRAFTEDIAAWGKIAKHIFIWDYITNYTRYISPFPNLMTLRPNTKFFTDCGAVAIYEEGGYQQAENGEFRSLRAYLTGQAQWDPYMSEETYDGHLRSFLRGYYGEGWEAVYEYVLRTSEKAAEGHMGIFFDPVTIFRDAEGKPDLPFLLAMQSLWDKAEAAASDARTLKNVRCSRCQIDFMVLSARAALEGHPDPAGNRAFVAALREAGVVFHREGGGKVCVVDGLTDRVCDVCAPNEWVRIANEDFRREHGISFE